MKIRYYGHAGQLTGYGRAAENMIIALDRAGAQVEVRTLAPYETLRFEGANLPVANMLRTDAQLDPQPDAIIVHTLPMDCPRVVGIAQAEGVIDPDWLRPLWVAYTTWEAEGVPFSLTPYEVFDDVWHPSPASAHGWTPKLKANHGGTCAIMPHCFDESLLPFYRDRPAYKPGEPYRFYSIGAFNVRKNIVGLVRAFAHEFTRQDNVELLLVSSGMTEAQLTQTIWSTGMRPEDLPVIRAELKTLDESQLWRMHKNADCFVSASRGEAWNLPAFEAILAGRYVIAPEGQGHETFLQNTSAGIYPAYLTPAQVQTIATRDDKGTRISTLGAQGLTSRVLWREPDLVALASYMRRAYDKHITETTVHYDIEATFGMGPVGQLAINRLNLLNVQRNLKP